MRALLWMAAIALASTSSACKKHDHPSSGPAPKKGSQLGNLGVRIYDGAAEDLRVTSDNRFATFLVNGEKPRIDGIPPQMRIGELWSVSLEGGSPRKLGNGVTNVPGGYLFSKDGRWVLFLAGYNAANQAGALNVFDLRDPSADPIQVGSNVTYALASPDGGHVAFVENGVLRVGPLPSGPFRDVAGEVSTASFSPTSELLFFKRRVSAAGGLGVVRVAAADGEKVLPVKLADQVGDYGLSPEGRYLVFTVRNPSEQGMYDLFHSSTEKFSPKKIATGGAGFAFSPDGQWLARIEGQRPEELGGLVLGPADGSAGRKIGDKVSEFSFSSDSRAIAALELYDISARAGVLAVAEVEAGKAKRVGNRVPNFVWSDDGKYVAFLSRFMKPLYSVDLMLYARGKPAAVKAHPGVFGYGFTGKDGPLIFRSNCIRNGRACDLFGADPEKVAELPTEVAAADAGTQEAAPQPAEALSKMLVEKIYSFKVSEDGSKILLTYARMELGDNYDVAVYDLKSGNRVTLDNFALLPALFGARDGSKVVYILGRQSRGPGVYVADTDQMQAETGAAK